MKTNIMLVYVLTLVTLTTISYANNIKSKDVVNSDVSDKQRSQLVHSKSSASNSGHNLLVNSKTVEHLNIEGTNLTTNTPYYIKTNDTEKLLRSQVGYGDIYGLIYYPDTVTGINNSSDGADYVFYIELDVNNLVRIRHNRTNLYISYIPYSNTRQSGFILSNETSYYNKSLYLIVRSETGYISLRTPVVTTTSYLSSSWWYDIISLINPVNEGYTSYQFIPAVNLIPPEPTPPSIPSNIALNADIRQFSYSQTPKSPESLSLLPITLINNTSPVTITEQVSQAEKVIESLHYKYREVSKLNLTITTDVELPRFNSRFCGHRIIPYVNFNATNISDRNGQKFLFERQYPIRKNIAIPAFTAVKFEAFVEFLKNAHFLLTAEAEITGTVVNASLTGKQIFDIINNIGKYTILAVNDYSVVIEVNGTLTVNIGLCSKFVVNTIDDSLIDE